MSIGLLLVLNFLTIPFLQEAEELGKRTGKFPAFIEIFYLKNTFYFYGFLARTTFNTYATLPANLFFELTLTTLFTF